MRFKNLINTKKIFAWSLYDFAGQPFTTIVVTFIYSSFFIKNIASNETVGTQMWSNSIAISAIIVAFLSPIFGAIADKGSLRRILLMIFTLICCVATMALYFPVAGQVYFSLILFVIANVSYEICSVFYNSYLPDISNSKNTGAISGFAWGLGFFGGIIALFLINYFFDFDNLLNVRKTNIFVGIWFLIFSIPLFVFMKDSVSLSVRNLYFKKSFKSISNTFRLISKNKLILNFLIARLFYNDGLITIFGLGGIYAVTTLDFTFSEVVKLAIVLNISAGLGSFIFGYIEDIIGYRKVINISLIVLILATLIAFLAPMFIYSKEIFWFSGILIGLMVGPNQSCSRSLMSQIIPNNNKNEFFGFYSFTGKVTSFIGPFLFGVVTSFYSQQYALWIVIILLLIGFIIFNRINFNSLN